MAAGWRRFLWHGRRRFAHLQQTVDALIANRPLQIENRAGVERPLHYLFGDTYLTTSMRRSEKSIVPTVPSLSTGTFASTTHGSNGGGGQSGASPGPSTGAGGGVAGPRGCDAGRGSRTHTS